jgi:hypothetical protein
VCKYFQEMGVSVGVGVGVRGFGIWNLAWCAVRGALRSVMAGAAYSIVLSTFFLLHPF